MTRRERNIRRRLAYHLEKARRESVGRSVQWQIDDCGMWQADIQKAATGFDPAAKFRGRYKTKRGAHRALGVLGLPMALQRLAGRSRRVDPKQARVGDVGLIANGRAFSCVRKLHRGAFDPVKRKYRGEWIGRSEGGFSMVPTAQVRMAWRAI